MFTSYAQNFEDLMLWKALRHVTTGFYIDIGAQDPITDSVSYAFYQQGWRGIHVEPVPVHAEALRNARPDETVIQAAVGTQEGIVDFYEFPGTGWSTGNSTIADGLQLKGAASKRISVVGLTLESILEAHRQREIHWLKIDVEGMEDSVIDSWGSSAVRPWIVVVEATLPTTQIESFSGWEPRLKRLGYIFSYVDGLNRFYVSEQRQDLLAAFKYPPNVFDDFALSGTAQNSVCSLLTEKLSQRDQRIADLGRLIVDVQRQLSHTQSELRFEAQQNIDNADKAKAAADSLDSLSQQNEQLRGALSAKDEALLSARSELITAHRDAIRRQCESDSKQSAFIEQLERSRSEGARALEALSKRERRISELQSSLMQLAHDSIQTSTIVADKEKMLESLRNEVEHQKELAETRRIALNEISTSLSWKIATLLRRMGIDRSDSSAGTVGRATSLAALLDMEGPEFVREAYRKVLYRDPDPSGASHYLGRLEKGASKITVLGILRYSREGKSKKANIPGLAWCYTKARLARFLRLRDIDRHKTVHVQTLISFVDKAFIENAYQTILRRPSDRDGYAFYLNRLRSGTSKVQILGEIRYSTEGRKTGVPVSQLRKKMFLERSSRLPIVGRIIWAWIHSDASTVWCEEHRRWCLRSDAQ